MIGPYLMLPLRARVELGAMTVNGVLRIPQSSSITRASLSDCFASCARQSLGGLDIGLGVRVFANRPGDMGSIPGRVIPKTPKMVLDASLLNTQHYKVRIKGKVERSREGVAPSPTPWCSSYRKGSLRVTLDYGRQLYLLLPLFRDAVDVFYSPSRLGKDLCGVWSTISLPLLPGSLC